MSNPASSAALSNDTAADGAGDAAYYRRVLHELIEMGADLARMVHGQAQAEPAAAEAPALVAAFDRVARTIRRTIGLARRLDAPEAGLASRAGRRLAVRRQIIRAVEDSIHELAPERQSALEAELLERLDGPDLADDIDHRPVMEIIAEIRRDLGLSAVPGRPYCKRRNPAEIAVLCARAAGSQAPGPAAMGGADHREAGAGAGASGVRLAAWPSGG